MEGTMTEKKTDRSTIIYLILSTLAESRTGEAPESFIYLPINQKLDVHLDAFNAIVGIAIDIGWVERKPGPVLSLTEDGRKLVAHVDAALATEKSRKVQA
jgi:hypothetical protein